MAKKDIWAVLEETAPSGCEGVQDLYSWSRNYGGGKGPFTLFLDLIGWSEDHIGADVYNYSDRSLGYVELSRLAKALEEYSAAPHDVLAYVDVLMAAESGELEDDSETDDRSVVEVLDAASYLTRNPDASVLTCEACGRSWDDSVATAWTPAPSARCPFESDHEDTDEDTADEDTEA